MTATDEPGTKSGAGERSPGEREIAGRVDAEAEIRELHEFFERWYRGDTEETETAFVRFGAALGPGFRLVSPEGDVYDRRAILDAVRKGHSAEGDVRIWIENIKVRKIGRESIFATYEEWQSSQGETTGRISTVLFKIDPHGFNGVLWMHVHETWLPGGGSER